jgi:PAS domain S-box-containing protein
MFPRRPACIAAGAAVVTQAIVVTDREGVICSWSPGAETLFGHAAASAIGQTLDLIVPEGMRVRHWAGFRAAMARGAAKISGVTAPIRVLRSRGDIVKATGVLRLLRGPHNTVIGAIAVYEVPEE